MFHSGLMDKAGGVHERRMALPVVAQPLKVKLVQAAMQFSA